MNLEWRLAEQSDIVKLQHFGCAKTREVLTAGGTVTAPRHWEVEVQKIIRRLHPPTPLEQHVYVGVLSGSIQAVIAVLDEPSHPRLFHLQLIGVAVPQRGQGGLIADEAVAYAIQAVAKLVVSSKTSFPVLLTAKVHRQNKASQHCLRRAGFTINVDGVGSKYEEWLLRIDIASDVDAH